MKQFEEWYPTPPRYLEWLERTTPWGAVVQCAELDGAGADEVYIRSVCLFLLEGERIVEHITYCTGGWDAAARERHEREAPMVQGERSMR